MDHPKGMDAEGIGCITGNGGSIRGLTVAVRIGTPFTSKDKLWAASYILKAMLFILV